MEKCRNLRVGEDCWRRVKQIALNQGVTVREVVERLVFSVGATHPQWQAQETTVKELTYDAERES